MIVWLIEIEDQPANIAITTKYGKLDNEETSSKLLICFSNVYISIKIYIIIEKSSKNDKNQIAIIVDYLNSDGGFTIS